MIRMIYNYCYHCHLLVIYLMGWVFFILASLSFIIFLKRSKKREKISPYDKLYRRVFNGEINGYEYEQLKRKLDKRENFKVKKLFLSVISKFKLI
jgi:hypothetical protein